MRVRSTNSQKCFRSTRGRATSARRARSSSPRRPSRRGTCSIWPPEAAVVHHSLSPLPVRLMKTGLEAGLRGRESSDVEATVLGGAHDPRDDPLCAPHVELQSLAELARLCHAFHVSAQHLAEFVVVAGDP